MYIYIYIYIYHYYYCYYCYYPSGCGLAPAAVRFEPSVGFYV